MDNWARKMVEDLIGGREVRRERSKDYFSVKIV